MDLYHKDWLKRSIGIPEGFLNYVMLRILSRTPMSGSELIEEVDRRTGWKPGPGSIYPLLRKYRDDGLIESEEADLDRFALTEKGMEQLREYQKRIDIFRRKVFSIVRMCDEGF